AGNGLRRLRPHLQLCGRVDADLDGLHVLAVAVPRPERVGHRALRIERAAALQRRGIREEVVAPTLQSARHPRLVRYEAGLGSGAVVQADDRGCTLRVRRVGRVHLTPTELDVAGLEEEDLEVQLRGVL